jgi:hypothetical protein
VVVDKRVLGITPTALRFKPNIPFELTFVHEGHVPAVKWLTVWDEPGAPTGPRVTLRAPPVKVMRADNTPIKR